MKSKHNLTIILLIALFPTSCVTAPPLVEFRWSLDTTTWTLHNVNSLEVRVPRELRLVRLNPKACAFAISGYEGGRSTDYSGFIVRDGIYVKYPMVKSVEIFRNSVVSDNGIILGDKDATDVLKYMFPMSRKIDQKTGKNIVPAIIKNTAYGWVFRSKEGQFCNVYLEKVHDEIEHKRWTPESVFSAAELELLDKVYHIMKSK